MPSACREGNSVPQVDIFTEDGLACCGRFNVAGGGGFAWWAFLNWDLRGGRGIVVKTSCCKLFVGFSCWWLKCWALMIGFAPPRRS